MVQSILRGYVECKDEKGMSNINLLRTSSLTPLLETLLGLYGVSKGQVPNSEVDVSGNLVTIRNSEGDFRPCGTEVWQVEYGRAVLVHREGWNSYRGNYADAVSARIGFVVNEEDFIAGVLKHLNSVTQLAVSCL